MLGLGLGISPCLSMAQLGFLTEANTLFSAMTTSPSEARKIVINQFIKDLQDAGLWSKLDALWVMAAHDQQAATLNWKNPGTFTLTEVSAPAWTVDRGYTGDGVADYLNTNFNPSINGVNFTQNSASLGVYVGTDANGNLAEMGHTTVANGCIIRPRNAGNNQMRVNAATQPSISVANSLGFFEVDRTSSILTTMYKGGASFGTDPSVSVAPANNNLFMMATNNNGTAAQFTTRRLQAGYVGAGGLNHASFNTAVETYMDALGAGVQ